jgi:hypothetical protein
MLRWLGAVMRYADAGAMPAMLSLRWRYAVPRYAMPCYATLALCHAVASYARLCQRWRCAMPCHVALALRYAMPRCATRQAMPYCPYIQADTLTTGLYQAMLMAIPSGQARARPTARPYC